MVIQYFRSLNPTPHLNFTTYKLFLNSKLEFVKVKCVVNNENWSHNESMTKHITQVSLYSAVKTILVKVELYVLPERCMKE